MKLNAMLHSTLKPCLVLAATASLLTAVGCTSTVGPKNDPKVGATSIRLNPTPRLQSLTRSYEENLNLFARTQDNRVRAIHDDIQMILFLNRNPGLTEFDYPLR